MSDKNGPPPYHDTTENTREQFFAYNLHAARAANQVAAKEAKATQRGYETLSALFDAVITGQYQPATRNTPARLFDGRTVQIQLGGNGVILTVEQPDVENPELMLRQVIRRYRIGSGFESHITCSEFAYNPAHPNTHIAPAIVDLRFKPNAEVATVNSLTAAVEAFSPPESSDIQQ